MSEQPKKPLDRTFKLTTVGGLIMLIALVLQCVISSYPISP